MGDKRIYELTKIESAPGNGVLPIDVSGSEETNGITVDNLAKTMPVATSDRNGIMSSRFLNSIYYSRKAIEPNGTFDTGIKSGGLIMVQNASSVNSFAVAIIYADGKGIVISEAYGVSFFGRDGLLDVRKDGTDGTIQIVNNVNIQQTSIIRIICLIV